MSSPISNSFDAMVEGSGRVADELSDPAVRNDPAPGVDPRLTAAVDDAAAQNERGRDKIRDGAEKSGEYSRDMRELQEEGGNTLRGVGGGPEMPTMPSVPESAEAAPEPFFGAVAPLAAPMGEMVPMTAPMMAAASAPMAAPAMSAPTMSAPAPLGLGGIDPSVLLALVNATRERTHTDATAGVLASTPVEKAASAHSAMSPQGAQPLDASQVSLQRYPGGHLSPQQAAAVIDQALTINGVPNDPTLRARWQDLYQHMARHESGLDPNAVNNSDSNATGVLRSDGGHANSSRGMWQCIPSTFAAYHMGGTSTSIYDPVASAAASMNYVMHRYHVAPTGEGLSAFAARQGVGRGSYQGY